jgi:hypothetical protein
LEEQPKILTRNRISDAPQAGKTGHCLFHNS